MARQKKNKGLEQAKDIYEIYNNHMDLSHKETFMLGRISILLEFGNNISGSLNTIIKDSEKTLAEIQEKIQKGEK